MKIALVHDRLTGLGGSERVALTLAETFKAEVYTAKYDLKKTYPEFRNFQIYEVNPVPDFSAPQTRPLAWMLDAINFLKLGKLKEYDYIITSGQFAHFASVQNPNNIWYCHTPNRAIYELREKVRLRLSAVWKPTFDLWVKFWKPCDQNSIKHVHKIVVNSENTRNRVKKFYNRSADVVYPPVDIKKFYNKPSENYWLSVQRIEPEKRIEIQLEVFKKLSDENLVIIGKSEYEGTYQEKINNLIEQLPNVTWKKETSDRELVEFYSKCKGVIQTAHDEDFGLVPVEAMASGKPCIAVDEGGFRETIIHGKTGLLIKKPYVKNFVNIIKNFKKYEFDPKLCKKRAQDFSKEKFIKKIKNLLMGNK